MNDEPLPQTLAVPMPAMVNLAIEYWRMQQWLAPLAEHPRAAPARHALRRMEDFLTAVGLEVRTLDGEAFDPGLAVTVIDTVDDPELPQDKAVISETLSPMVLWRGTVVKAADVVTRRGLGH